MTKTEAILTLKKNMAMKVMMSKMKAPMRWMTVKHHLKKQKIKPKFPMILNHKMMRRVRSQCQKANLSKKKKLMK